LNNSKKQEHWLDSRTYIDSLSKLCYFKNVVEYVYSRIVNI